MKFKDFQNPPTSNYKTFNTHFGFPETFQQLEKRKKNVRALQSTCGYPVQKHCQHGPTEVSRWRSNSPMS